MRDSTTQVPPSRPMTITPKRDALASGGRLRWFHWVVVVLSIGLTLFAWWLTRAEVNGKIETRFDQEADLAISLVGEQIRSYEDGLWGGVAAIQSNGGGISYREWKIFADTLAINEKYPGVNGVGVIHRVARGEVDAFLEDQRVDRPDFAVHPDHGESELLPITYIEPATSNAAAVGLDMAHETTRYQGIQRARDTGEAQITGPIVLVQDEMHTPGFLLFAPWYRGETPGDVEGRRENFVGAVYAPFVMTNLMAGAVAEERRHIGLRITDGTDVLYDEHQPTFADFDPDPMFTRSVSVEMYGRNWTFDIRSSESFRYLASSSEPMIILVGGLLIDALLLGVFLGLSRANRRALRFADELTQELQVNSGRLEDSNAELEKFAYVASHDLKTPLRGIAHLAEYLQEDLREYLESDAADPSVRKNLGRLHGQVDRMNNLIDGILAYSRIGEDGAGPTTVIDLPGVIDILRADLQVGADQLRFAGCQEACISSGVYFEQVVTNLVVNAFAHHHDPTNAGVDVVFVLDGDVLTVSVADDGPGIDGRYQERIFEVFQTLGGERAGTGIGLSIVKKILDRTGGGISLVSALGEGATFTFAWPADPAGLVGRPSRPAGPKASLPAPSALPDSAESAVAEAREAKVETNV